MPVVFLPLPTSFFSNLSGKHFGSNGTPPFLRWVSNHREIKGRFRKRVVLANVFVPGNIRQNHPFENHPSRVLRSKCVQRLRDACTVLVRMGAEHHRVGIPRGTRVSFPLVSVLPVRSCPINAIAAKVISKMSVHQKNSRRLYSVPFSPKPSDRNKIWKNYHLAKKDGILTKSLWTRNFRICNAMGLPNKIRETPTFEYVVQPNVLGSQAPDFAIFQVINFGNMYGNPEFFGSQVLRRGWHEIFQGGVISNMLCHLMAWKTPQEFDMPSFAAGW